MRHDKSSRSVRNVTRFENVNYFICTRRFADENLSNYFNVLLFFIYLRLLFWQRSSDTKNMHGCHPRSGSTVTEEVEFPRHSRSHKMTDVLSERYRSLTRTSSHVHQVKIGLNQQEKKSEKDTKLEYKDEKIRNARIVDDRSGSRNLWAPPQDDWKAYFFLLGKGVVRSLACVMLI